ncbi:MAG: (2Fe-2S) ferredoxin domain-containing protein, partial [Dehalococcoidia bacterium]|nr:(2Fe-2S) ferredoxin domain-containing protein [Dehalococcoidia bacterium]
MNDIARQDIDTAFEHIKRRAVSRAAELYDGQKPTIMIGTATCGKAAGAIETLDAIKDELAQKGMDANVMEVGCMGHCYAEPLVIINKPG